MPNYCLNRLRIGGPVDLVRELTFALSIRSYAYVEHLNTPDEAGRLPGFRAGPAGTEEDGVLSFSSVLPRPLGVVDGLMFNLGQWGTKWEAATPEIEISTPAATESHLQRAADAVLAYGDVDSEAARAKARGAHENLRHPEVAYTFTTANSHPFRWAREVANRFPGVVLELKADEPGNDVFDLNVFYRAPGTTDVADLQVYCEEDMTPGDDDLTAASAEHEGSDEPDDHRIHVLAARRLLERTSEDIFRSACLESAALYGCRDVSASEAAVRQVRERGVDGLTTADLDRLTAQNPRTPTGYGCVDALMAHIAAKARAEATSEPCFDVAGDFPYDPIEIRPARDLCELCAREADQGGDALARLLGSDCGILINGRHVFSLMAQEAATERAAAGLRHVIANASMTPLQTPGSVGRVLALPESDPVTVVLRGFSQPVQYDKAEDARLRSLLHAVDCSGPAMVDVWEFAVAQGLPREVMERSACASVERLERFLAHYPLSTAERALQENAESSQYEVGGPNGGKRTVRGLHPDITAALDRARDAELFRGAIDATRSTPAPPPPAFTAGHKRARL